LIVATGCPTGRAHHTVRLGQHRTVLRITGARDRMLASGWLGLDWGNVPAWVGSVLTGVALLVAANTYRKSVRDSERAQATKVTVWTGLTDEKETFSVKNGSDASIYSVAVYYRGGAKSARGDMPYYAVRKESSGLKGLGRWASIGPGEERSADLERNAISDPAIPWISFRDANGVDWIRDYRARLSRHSYKWVQSISEAHYTGKESIRFRGFIVVLILGLIYDDVKKRLRRVFMRKVDPAVMSEDKNQAPKNDSTA